MAFWNKKDKEAPQEAAEQEEKEKKPGFWQKL